ncbi:AAA family ATPase [Sporomusa acidovorans]|uniref:AAA family ATPase n=1 Tax=Sporomusa acidovorans (strain ATCC 49682 / DSM 3132 / Mol) TaxID=1123286 RepID=A0ABZ3JAB4_SPOA4|nr:AAA family ATPase [Sporomusa acidovorans]OZC22977.1 hypothetical protein SPACI_10500 [Sporomusa acidovorans DSM 3132]SDE93545.1 hypothetical protein SAMN04488499_10273 [Sporomusa acidovorans]
MKKETVLNEIIKYYIKSHDFNGLPVYNMKSYDYNILCELIDEGLIEVLSEKEVINPHIKGFDFTIPVDRQKENISKDTNYSVLYPTRKALESVPLDYTKPYSVLMQKGEKQFKIIYFNIEILERYVNNPKFVIMDNGYRGNICVKDEYIDDKTIEDEYIKNYGMAYIDGKHLERAVGVFVCDLAKLSSQKQMLWKGFELTNQRKCKINAGFVDNLIKGKWVMETWIFHDLLEEIKVINEQCEHMGIPKLFNKTFGTHYSEMPEGFRNILLPTLKNYYDFVLVFEKIIVHNISYKTFQKDTLHIQGIDRKDELGKDKGSLVMLEEWLGKNIRTQENITDLIIKPLKTIRNIRQKPAHELTSNQYDVTLYQKQFDLMNDTYTAIRAIRLFFANHPLTKDVKVPEHLVSGKGIVNY